LTIVATLVAEPTAPVEPPPPPTAAKPTPTPPTTKVEKVEKVDAKPTEKPDAKATGTLVLKTTPWWGNVEVDGRVQDDTTPLTLTLSAGRHDVVVTHPPKGLSKRFKVVVPANNTVVRVINFE
jgi:hypothetical protein